MNGRKVTNRTLSREAGMTTLGFLILVVFVGLFAFAAIRLAPVYLNYIKVAGVLDGVYDEFDSQNPSRGAIRTSINRRFEVESVDDPGPGAVRSHHAIHRQYLLHRALRQRGARATLSLRRSRVTFFDPPKSL